MEAISIFFSSNEGIVITTLSVTNCIFLISTIFLTLLRKAKQGGENGENIELQQMLPLPAEEIQAPQDKINKRKIHQRLLNKKINSIKP